MSPVEASSRSAALDTLATVHRRLPDVGDHPPRPTAGQTIDFATSNVKGSPVPMFVAGAQLIEIYPIGPLGGVAFNLTLMSLPRQPRHGVEHRSRRGDRAGHARRFISDAVDELVVFAD